MEVRGLICEEVGSLDALKMGTINVPDPAKEQIMVEVDYGSVNFPDLLMVKGLYQQRPPLPYAVGAELSGTVRQVGEGVTRFKVGDQVAAYALTGAFSERTNVSAERAILLPAGMDQQAGAAFLVTYGTSYHALIDRAKIARGDRLVVLGAAGGVGLAAVEIGAMMGAEVIACASTEEKLALCKEYGATHTINYSEQDLSQSLKAMLGPRGADIVYDPVGGDYSETAFRRLGYGGRHLVIGFTAGSIPKLPFNLPLLKSAALVGAYWGSFCMHFPKQALANHEKLAGWIAGGNLRPHIDQVFPLDNALAALRHLDERKAMGKVLVQCR